jgi:hypothetical protein
MVGRYAGARRHECDGVARVTGDTGGGAVLTFNHARGGGSSRYLDLFEEQLVQGGHAVLRLRAVHKAPTLGVIHDPGNHPDGMHARCFDLAGDRQALEDFARRRQVGRLLVNHWVDRPKEAMTWVKDLADRLGCPYDIVLHDYYCVCPRINLVDSEGRFCGLPEIDVCNACVQKGGADIAVSPAEWRRAVQEFIAGAAKVIVPSADCAQRLRRLLPKEPVVWEPESDEDLPPENTPSVSANEPLRVAVLGAVNVPKGLSLLADVATRARASAAPLSFRVIGPASDPELLRKAGIPVSGPYPPQELDGLLASWTPHMVFLPAIWPETWSFVLSTALRHALPVATFALGAPADRLRRLGRGHVFPVAWTDRPDEVLQALLSLRAGWLKRC